MTDELHQLYLQSISFAANATVTATSTATANGTNNNQHNNTPDIANQNTNNTNTNNIEINPNIENVMNTIRLIPYTLSRKYKIFLTSQQHK